MMNTQTASCETLALYAFEMRISSLYNGETDGRLQEHIEYAYEWEMIKTSQGLAIRTSLECRDGLQLFTLFHLVRKR